MCSFFVMYLLSTVQLRPVYLSNASSFYESFTLHSAHSFISGLFVGIKLAMWSKSYKEMSTEAYRCQGISGIWYLYLKRLLYVINGRITSSVVENRHQWSNVINGWITSPRVEITPSIVEDRHQSLNNDINGWITSSIVE
jgi:hypothetical protein